MTDGESQVRVVQCPKCGSPVYAVRPGEITRCGYCGSTLEMTMGASGYPIAQLANIETSTVYLARSEALRRMRERLVELDLQLRTLTDQYVATQQRIKQVRGQSSAKWWLWGGLAMAMSLLFLSPDESAACGGMGVLVGLALWAVAWSQGSKVKTAVARLERELAQISAAGTQTHVERDRLAARVAELEAGLDELARRL